MKMILDDIKQKFRLPDAYEDWREYRQLLTDTVIKCGNGDQSKTIAIIGAGRCNDIDLKALCRHFEIITLVDCDSDAMNEAVAKLTDDEAKRVEINSTSLTGINETDLNLFFESILSAVRNQGYKLTYDSFEEIILSELEIFKDKLPTSYEILIKELPERDIVLCNGVFSQLFSAISFFVRSVAGSIPDSLFAGAMQAADRLEQELKSMNNVVIPVICKALIQSANDYVIFGNECLKTDPVEGAGQCIEAVRNSGRTVKEFECLWDFNRREKVTYNMLIQVVTSVGIFPFTLYT